MRTMEIDKQAVYIAQRLPSVAEVGDDGYETGTMLPQYDTPVLYNLRVQNLTEDAEIQLWGADARSMKKITESVNVIGLADVSYLDSVWVGCVPTELADPDYIAPHGKNLVNVDDFDTGKLLNVSTGALITSASDDTTGFMPVVAGETYTLSHYYNLSYSKICYYGVDQAFISGSVISEATYTTVPLTVTIPTGACYARLSANKIYGTPTEDWQFEVGSVATTYELYYEQTCIQNNNYVVASTPVVTPRNIIIYLKSVTADG